ncbi:hypothetical protein RCL1_003577 [Eukaryota sp. TZLM3-RCL]
MSQPSKPSPFNNISYVVGTSKLLGTVNLSQDAVVWRARVGDSKHKLENDSIKTAQFIPLRHGYRLKLISDETTMLLDGFESTDKQRLESHLREHSSIALETPRWSAKGKTWGNITLDKDCVALDLDDGRAMELPFASISNANNPHKNEVELDFVLDDVAAETGDDYLCSIKFHVPDNYGDFSAQDIVSKVKENTAVSVSLTDVIAEFKNVTFVTPRGRYDVNVFSNLIRLHGKTHSYPVNATSVSRLFLLPHQDARSIFFVISLDRPIRQGATAYPHLVASIDAEQESQITLNLSAEDCERLYQNKLQPSMEGNTSKLIARVFRCITGTKVTIPGENGFKSAEGSACLKVAYKQNEGYFYPLEKSFIYLHKPPLLHRYDNIKAVEFSRVRLGGDSSRTFDMDIIPKTGEKMSFSQILKEEYDRIATFFKEKGLKVRNVVEEGAQQRVMEYEDELEGAFGGSSDESDNEFAAEESESESDVEEEEEEGLAEVAPLEKVDTSNIISEPRRKRRTHIS